MRVEELQLHIQQLTVQRRQPKMNRFCASPEDFHFYTRFPSEEVFIFFWESVSPSASRLVYWSNAQKVAAAAPSRQRKLNVIDECFMFFCRIAAGLKEQVLSSIFDVSVTTVNAVIKTWANYLYHILGSQPTWMTREQVQATMPEKFQRYCPNVRVLIDFAKIRCQNPSSLTLKSQSFSNHKNHTTFKGLVGIAPHGVVTFISKLYTGSLSDREITVRSGLTRLLLPGDGVVADKEFLIHDILEDVGATLITPPLKTTAQLSTTETEKVLVECRVLVERTIRRIKEYHIWDEVVPLSLAGSINQLWTVCCLLTSYQRPLNLEGDKPV